MIHQLRIYEIFEGNQHAFHDRFESHAIRIMESHGFEFVALWETTTGDGIEFVYLLEWPDEETMTRPWSEFMMD